MTDPVFGVDYYPEHWDEARWPIDADLMRQCGINTVRLAEFAWSRLEQSPGAFDFAWLDRAIDVLAARGMQVVLGTPTAAPPAWLIAAHPEILPVNEQGQRAGFGMRRHYCPRQPAFHEATRRIVRAMAAHYAEHPAVFAWQTDNELGNTANGTRCHCSCCQEAFQRWLQERYGSLDELNRRWGTIFWSQEYDAWEQVPLPLRTVGTHAPGSAHNPALYLDFARFSAEGWVRYQRIHVEILRAVCPRHRITHNLMGLFPYVDAAALAEDLDFVSWDNYPRLPGPWSPLDGDWSPERLAMTHDLMRGVKGRPFWVMEQQAGPSGWGMLSPTPLPGEIRLWTWQSIARGAEAIVYFRWRTCRFGTEQYWHGILPHDGAPGRRYQEVRRTGEELCRIGALTRAPVPVEAAILRSYETLWAFEAQPTAPELSYDDQIGRYYRALWRRSVPLDLVTEDRPWERYRLLIAPCLFVLHREVAERLRAWVAAGGTLVLSFRSGVKDADNMVVEAPLPGLLAELAGVRVSDYTALGRPQGSPLQSQGSPLQPPAGSAAPQGGPGKLTLAAAGTPYALAAEVWMDELELDGAQALGRYRGEPFDGAPAITLHRFGAGRVFYVGTALDDTGHDLLLGTVLAEAGIAPGPRAPDRVEMVRRVHEGVDHWFILNHGDQRREITLPVAGVDLLTGRDLQGAVALDGRDVIVLRAMGA